MRRSAWHFVSGKAISALLTFVILLWLVRLLPVSEYGAYMSFTASLEILIAISGLGLPWLLARFLPELRMHASGAEISAFAVRMQVRIGLSLLAFWVIGMAGVEAALRWAGLSEYLAAARLYLLVIAVECAGRHLRDSFLGSLMQQGHARASLAARQGSFLLLLACGAMVGNLTLLEVVALELAASMIGSTIAFVALRRHLRGLLAQPAQAGWRTPRLSAMWRTAMQMYGVNLLSLACSPQAFVLLLQRHSGAEAAALLGFLRSLYGIAARYLPATLLFSLIRPKLVSSYVAGGGITELTAQANLLGKLSLLVLMPVVVIAAVDGNTMIAALSGGRFTDSGWLLCGMMIGLLPLSQRSLLETVAVTLDRGGLCTVASASGLLMLPLMLWLLGMGWGIWAAVLAMVLGQWLFNAIVLGGLALDTAYRADLAGATKLLMAALIGYGASLLPLNFESKWIDLGVRALAIAALYGLAAWLLQAFSAAERARIAQLSRRRTIA